MITITANARELLSAVRFAGMAIERRNTIPVLGYALITVDGDGLTVAGTNLDQHAEKTIAVEADGATTFCAPPRLLDRFLTGLPGEVVVEVDHETIHLRADGCTMRIRKMQAVEDWPTMTFLKSEPTATAKLSVALLAKALRLAAISISTEETRYYLNGIYMRSLDDKLTMVATDGHRLTKYECDVTWPLHSMIVPRGMISMLRVALSRNQNGGVDCKGYPTASGAGAISFSGDNWNIHSKVIDGTFPDYTRVIPAVCDDISVSMTRAALSRLQNVEGHQSTVTVINGDGGTMTVKSPDMGSEIVVPCSGRGPQFGVNLKYIKDFAMHFDVLRLEGKGKGDPFRVLTDDPALTWVIMPMRF